MQQPPVRPQQPKDLWFQRENVGFEKPMGRKYNMPARPSARSVLTWKFQAGYRLSLKKHVNSSQPLYHAHAGRGRWIALPVTRNCSIDWVTKFSFSCFV